jgi:proline racemase
MALPSNTDLATLDYAYLGAPFVQVEAKALNSVSMDIAYLGQPFVAVGPSAAPPAATRYVLIT